ncbi:hypothetical protein TetV_469 [Tetraselmis virus 1]|uniref:Uncharacterized protein n=1 Tax=Tetraselmis virus 1 TaxID=2060617 RepID=A0A2P0VNS9_9VIRU|nr:hypothetical protein QJ968_gp585 [Tetraselmis virus 1]AUF82551.1 hypothetical protein TetV_469 [Tetraselmis virus 1]
MRQTDKNVAITKDVNRDILSFINNKNNGESNNDSSSREHRE